MITLGSEDGPMGQFPTSWQSESGGKVGIGRYDYLGVRGRSHGTGYDLVVEQIRR
jgi:hypothetical protein